MTVYVNGRYLCQNLSGVQRFATEILMALDRQLTKDVALAKAIGPVIVLHPQGVLRRPHWQSVVLKQVGRAHGHIWEQGALYHASKNGPLVSLGNAGPLRHQRHMLALHDANIWDIPNAFSPRYKVLHKAMRPILASRARQLLTVSQFSANALAKHLNISASRFSIIPNGSDHILNVASDPQVIKNNGLRNDGFFLCVGNLSPNKNMERLIRAHAVAGPNILPLVIAGGTAAGVEAQNISHRSAIKLLGRVSDSTLRALYEHAAGFIFPSLYEGFGIPPLEAMQLGTPVLASNSSAMPEVLADGAMFFDPKNTNEMSGVLQQFLELSDNAKADLIDRGKKVSARFTWEKSAALLAQRILVLKGQGSFDVQVARTTNAWPARKAS